MRSHFYPPEALMRLFDAPDLRVSLHEANPNFWVVVEKRGPSGFQTGDDDDTMAVDAVGVT